VGKVYAPLENIVSTNEVEIPYATKPKPKVNPLRISDKIPVPETRQIPKEEQPVEEFKFGQPLPL